MGTLFVVVSSLIHYRNTDGFFYANLQIAIRYHFSSRILSADRTRSIAGNRVKEKLPIRAAFAEQTGQCRCECVSNM